jgi:hypothetical protein
MSPQTRHITSRPGALTGARADVRVVALPLAS